MRIAMALAAVMISASSIAFGQKASEEPASTAMQQELLETLQTIQAEIDKSEKTGVAAMNAAAMKLISIMGNKMALERVTQDLMRSRLEDLYVLKVLPLPCMQANLIDCTGLENHQVKGVVDIAIEARNALQSERREEARAAQVRNDAWISRAMALGGIGISFCSLLVSGLTYRDKRRDASKHEAAQKAPT